MMSFCLWNVIQTQLHFNDNVTRGVFTDDILIARALEEGYVCLLHALFRRIQEAGVIINPCKCLFGVTSLSFLGHITPCGIPQEQEKVVTIREFPRPMTYRQLHKILGMFNCYRRFVLMCAQLL